MDRREAAGGTRVVDVTEFKAGCLELLETVRKRASELVITKRGEPIAREMPLTGMHRPPRGLLKDCLSVHGDIMQANWTDEWESAR